MMQQTEQPHVHICLGLLTHWLHRVSKEHMYLMHYPDAQSTRAGQVRHDGDMHLIHHCTRSLHYMKNRLARWACAVCMHVYIVNPACNHVHGAEIRHLWIVATSGSIKGLQLCWVMCKRTRATTLAATLLKINTHPRLKKGFVRALLLVVDACHNWLLLSLHKHYMRLAVMSCVVTAKPDASCRAKHLHQSNVTAVCKQDRFITCKGPMKKPLAHTSVAQMQL